MGLRFRVVGFRVSGPKYHNLNGLWDLKPHYLGVWRWTARVFCFSAVLYWPVHENTAANLSVSGVGFRV